MNDGNNVYRNYNIGEEEEDLDMALAIEASHKSLREESELQESMKVALMLQQEEEDSQLALALRQSEQERSLESKRRRMNAQVTRQTVNRMEGSWDCTQCTLLNEPYEPKCAACGKKAPKHILSFQPMPMSIRFGLEIEILMSRGKTDGFSLEKIAKHLHRMGPERVYFMGYTHQTSTDYWKIVTDSSIQENNPDGDLCFELVSPVLSGDAGLKSLRSIMNNLRSLGIDSNSSCGFHVHVDAENGSILGNLKALQSVCQCFVALENAFDLLVSHSWDPQQASHNRRANQNRYCRSNRLLSFQQQSNNQRWDTIANTTSIKQLVHLINPHNDRYRKLNLTNIVKHDRPSTVEFRHHGKVEHTQEAEAWVRLIVFFCQNCILRQNSIQQICLLPQESTPKAEIRALFQLVNCHGLEQYYIIDRRLFHEHRLQNVWYCRVCRKSFRDSRSLAQHCTALNHH